MKKENIIDIITDEDGRKIVVITDIRFKGKRNIDWEDVENYLKEYVGKCYEDVETADQVFIGNDLLIRHAADGNLYLYDMVNIKKETSTPLRQ